MLDIDRIRCGAQRSAHQDFAAAREAWPRPPPNDVKSLKWLRSGVFVTRSMAPEAFAALDLVRERFGIADEVLVHQKDGEDNGHHIPADRPVIGFSGGWLRGLAEDELLAVIGHELGHWLDWVDPHYGHTSLLADGMAAASRTLFRRGSEITADRCGLIASRSLHAAARLELRYAAGTAARLLEDIDGYLEQAIRAGTELEASGDAFFGGRHPEHLMRTYFAWLFSETDRYAELIGRPGGGRPFAEVDRRITQLVLREPKLTPVMVSPRSMPAPSELEADAQASVVVNSAGRAIEAVDDALLRVFGAVVPTLDRAFERVRRGAESIRGTPPPPPTQPAATIDVDADLEARFQELERRYGRDP